VRKNEADFVNTGARGDPSILRKEAKTTMLIADGETSVIGGIYTRNTGLSHSKVPWIADVPIIGVLFKNTREVDERTEVLIFLTPRITNKASLPCEVASERR
jgi:type IV pilus assembly protein PilQ